MLSRESPQEAPFRQLILSRDPEAFAESYPFNVSPVYDNSPFFFFTLKPSQILGAGTEQGIDWKVNMGVAVLLMFTAAVTGYLLMVKKYHAMWLVLITTLAVAGPADLELHHVLHVAGQRTATGRRRSR